MALYGWKQGVVLLRALDVGALTVGLWWHVAYLLVLAIGGFLVVARRLERVLTP